MLIFQYDTNHDGFLSKRELRQLIKERQCDDLPKGLAKKILQMHDADGDGHLDFDEFFALSQEHRWLVRDICVKYCRMVVPRRSGGHSDETGEFIRFDFCMIFFTAVKRLQH